MISSTLSQGRNQHIGSGCDGFVVDTWHCDYSGAVDGIAHQLDPQMQARWALRTTQKDRRHGDVVISRCVEAKLVGAA
jgi:hypothetical protein